MTMNPVYTKCPKCETKYSYTNKVTGDTQGVEIWSDGFCMTPMREDILEFAKCPACDTFFWLHENSILQPTDTTEIRTIENSWLIDNITDKEINFIKDAFRGGLANTNEKEIFLRIKLWQTINHITRKYSSQGLFKKIKQKIFDTAEYKDSQRQYNASISLKLKNLIRLANLLKLNKREDADHLLLAEIYRELGDFGKSLLFCHKAETSLQYESIRIMPLKQHITSKSKTAYKLQ